MDNNVIAVERKQIHLHDIWESQPPLMHSWLMLSSIGLVVLYFAMNISPF